MASNANIQFTFSGLPPNYCFTSFDRYALDIVAGMVGFLPGEFQPFVVSESEPAAEDRSKPWYKLLPGGEPSGKIFIYYLGKWVTPNPIAPIAAERRIFTGSESDAWSYDGGDGTDPTSNPPTLTTGAMWEVDHNFDFRFPIGAGTSPAPLSTVINPGGTGGEEQNTLTLPNIPLHGHPARYCTTEQEQSDAEGGLLTGGAEGSQSNLPAFTGDLGQTLGRQIGGTGGDADGETVAHNNMPPYRGVYFIKRTARQFFVA